VTGVFNIASVKLVLALCSFFVAASLAIFAFAEVFSILAFTRFATGFFSVIQSLTPGIPLCLLPHLGGHLRSGETEASLAFLSPDGSPTRISCWLLRLCNCIWKTWMDLELLLPSSRLRPNSSRHPVHPWEIPWCGLRYIRPKQVQREVEETRRDSVFRVKRRGKGLWPIWICWGANQRKTKKEIVIPSLQAPLQQSIYLSHSFNKRTILHDFRSPILAFRLH